LKQNDQAALEKFLKVNEAQLYAQPSDAGTINATENNIIQSKAHFV